MAPLRRRSRLLRRSVLSAGMALPASAVVANPIRLEQLGAQEGKDIGPLLQKAVDAGGDAILIAPGNYRIDTPLVVRAAASRAKQQEIVSRTPGPVILGAGTKRTVIECAVANGAPIQIDQEVPYAFTVDGRIEGLTLRGKRGIPEQDGIRISGAWNYAISDVEIVGFSGNGLSAPWREDLRAELEEVTIEAGSTIARKPGGEGFGTGTGLIATMRLYGDGLRPGTTLVRFIDSHSIEMSLPATRSAKIVLGSVGNSDAFQSIISVHSCRFMENGGWGIWGGAGRGLILNWANCEAQLNRKGGVFCAGGAWRIAGGAIYDNGQDSGCGLMVDRVFGAPSLVTVDAIEFDSNHRTQVWLKDVDSAVIYQSRFISHYYDIEKANRAPVGIMIGDPDGRGRAVRVKVEQCHFRSPVIPASDYSCVRLGKAGSYDAVDIDEPFWITRHPEHRWFADDPHPQSQVKVTENGRRTYASQTARAAALFEKTVEQPLAAGVWIELVMQRIVHGAGTWDGHTAVTAELRAGSTDVVVRNGADLPRSRRPQPVVCLTTSAALSPGSTLSTVSGRLVLSRPALLDGEHVLVVGGMTASYAQLYDVEATFAVGQARPGTPLVATITLDDIARREFAMVLGGGLKETVTLRATLPVPSATRLGIRLRHEGPEQLVVLGGALAGGLRIAAME